MGLSYEVFSPDVDENLEGSPTEVVIELARRKAVTAAEVYPECVILAADTLVSVGDEVLGKPQDTQDAERMLKLLNGTWHEVHTGVCVIAEDVQQVGHAVTQVLFAAMSPEEILAYCRSGEPMGKAGAYAIQGLGGMFIDQIRGSYTNVVGLPTSLVRQLLRNLKIL
jgi:septum formation protein